MIEITNSVPETIEVVKGCRNYPALPKGLVATVRFQTVTITCDIKGEAPYKAVRVDFGWQSIYLAGNRVKIPELTRGKEFNLHNGNPLEYVRIRIT